MRCISISLVFYYVAYLSYFISRYEEIHLPSSQKEMNSLFVLSSKSITRNFFLQNLGGLPFMDKQRHIHERNVMKF